VSRRRLPWFVQAAAIALAAALLVEGAHRTGLAVERLDHGIASAWHRLAGPRTPHPEVVIIAVDDATLEQVRDPFIFWGPHFAAAVARLRSEGASVIGIDFLLEESAEGWFTRNGLQHLDVSRTLDAPLRAELFTGDVVLASSYELSEAGEVRQQLPNRDYLAVLQDPVAQVGLTDLPLDPDQVVRRFRPVFFETRDRPALSMSLALVLEHLGLSARDAEWELAGHRVGSHSGTVELVFAGSGGTVPRIPLHRLLGEAPLEPSEVAAIEGAVALIGPTWSSSGDWFVTPYTGPTSQGMRGVEVHATAVATLLSGERIGRLGRGGRLLALLLTSLTLGGVLFRVQTRGGVIAFAVHTLAWPLVGLGAFAGAAWLLPVGSAVVAGLLVFGAAVVVRYAEEQRKRAFLSRAFGRYVSGPLLEQLLEAPESLGLGGIRKDVTVLFTDMKGFTTLSERMSPEEVVEMLNAFFARACRPILDHGGEINTYLGDAVMAVWGAPLDDPDHARHAMQAALEVSAEAIRFRTWMAERFSDRDLPVFDIGVGVHSGPAVAGNLGIEEHMEYSVIGDTVNAAARIEGLTRETGCRVLVSQEALDRGGPLVKTGKRAELKVKGREAPVVVFELLAVDESGLGG